MVQVIMEVVNPCVAPCPLEKPTVIATSRRPAHNVSNRATGPMVGLTFLTIEA
jgi:hypothetical protein